MTHLTATDHQILILLGPPGAGKGTGAALVKEKLHLAHISTGDLLRENIKNETPLGTKARSYMDQGQLVPDDLIFEMLFTRVAEKDCKNGYILDGFPRNLDQAEALSKRLGNQSLLALNLEIPDAAILDRITKRQVCKSCQTPYHLTNCPPKQEGRCDKCHGELYHRSDDTEEVIKKRLDVYHAQTAPLIEYYKKQNALHTIDSSKSKEAVLLQMLKALGHKVKK